MRGIRYDLNIQGKLEAVLKCTGLASQTSLKILLDVAGSYPNGQCAMNSSKETTKREVCEIIGIDDEIRRKQGLNLSGGQTNAAEFCQAILAYPVFDDLLNEFIRDEEAIES